MNQVTSQLARLTKLGCFVNGGREVSVASTKAFTAQAVTLVLVAAWFAERREDDPSIKEKREQLIKDLKELSSKMESTINKVHPLIKEIAETIKDTKNITVLGRDSYIPIAMEGALKLKEITYINSYGLGCKEIKHGSLALVEPDKGST